MNDRMQEIPWIDGRLVNENRNKYPTEELRKYAGQYVAWSLDGSCILASGSDELEMEKHLQEMGIDPSKVIGEYIPPSDLSVIGGFFSE